jgi:hypothetical protein
MYSDILGKIVPGTVMLVTFAFTTTGPEQSLEIMKICLDTPSRKYPSTIVLLGLGLVLSYVLGNILWGLWFLLSLLKRRLLRVGLSLFKRYLWQPRSSSFKRRFLRWILRKREVDRGTGIPEKKVGDFHMKHDYLKLNDTTIGNRITKLKAQIHMSGVLILGFSLCLVVNLMTLCKSFNTSRVILGVVLLASALGSYGVWNHFIHHLQTEVDNNAKLLGY